MKNVIVTGGAGFIGSNLCKSLKKNGYNPIIIDNLSRGFKELAKYGEFFEIDYGNKEKVDKIFKKFKPLAIFHIGSFKDVAESVENPELYYKNNVEKTRNLIEITVENNIRHFIFSSSAAIFGEVSDVELVNENYTPNPINPYGKSKLDCEKLLEKFSMSNDFIYSSLRYFNVNGADPECELGEMNKDAKNVFSVLSRKLFNNEEFSIFGDDYETRDGSCIRDYIHIYDLVEAHILALTKQIQSQKSVKINLGNGTGFSVKELVENFKKVTNKDLKIKIASRREGDPKEVIADNKFAKEYLGFEPKFNNISDHISHQISWYKKNFNV